MVWFGLSWVILLLVLPEIRDAAVIINWLAWGSIVQDDLTYMVSASRQLDSLPAFLFLSRLVHAGLHGVLRAAEGGEGKL